MSDLRKIETELRLFRAVVEGSQEIRAHVLRKFSGDCFVHLRGAWQLVIDKISKDEPISLDLLWLNGELMHRAAGFNPRPAPPRIRTGSAAVPDPRRL